MIRKFTTNLFNTNASRVLIYVNSIIKHLTYMYKTAKGDPLASFCEKGCYASKALRV